MIYGRVCRALAYADGREAVSMAVCHAVTGASYTLGAIGTSECWGSANSGERKETKALSTIQPSQALLMFSPGKLALHLTLLLSSGRKYEQKIRSPTLPTAESD